MDFTTIMNSTEKSCMREGYIEQEFPRIVFNALDQDIVEIDW